MQAFEVLGDFMSLVGGCCSLTCSLLLPALFFLCLYWKASLGAQSASCIARYTAVCCSYA